jgi:uncharacterized membrane protein
VKSTETVSISYGRVVARMSICAALIVVAVGLDMVIGLVPLPIRPAIVTVLTVTVLTHAFDYKTALFCGAFWGVVSCLISLFGAISLSAELFRNPLISVLPRFLVCAVTYPLYTLLTRAAAGKKTAFVRDYLPRGLTAALAVLLNTTLVLSGISAWLYFFPSEYGSLVNLLELTLLFNFTIEFCAALFLNPPVGVALSKARRGAPADTADDGCDPFDGHSG